MPNPAVVEANTPIHIIKELAGHRSIETTLRYMHTNAEARADAIRMTSAPHVGPSAPALEEMPHNLLKLRGKN